MIVGATTQAVVSLVLSIAALALGLFNFWWNNRRKGNVHVGEPRTYALCVPNEGNVILELPLVFANDGPRTRVIRNIRLQVPDFCGDRLMVFMATHEKLGSTPNAATGRTFATAFVLAPNGARLVIGEFQATSLGRWEPAPFAVAVLLHFHEHVEGWRETMRRLAHRRPPDVWTEIRTFTVRVDTGAEFGRLLVHDNAEEPTLARATTA